MKCVLRHYFLGPVVVYQASNHKLGIVMKFILYYHGFYNRAKKRCNIIMTKIAIGVCNCFLIHDL